MKARDIMTAPVYTIPDTATVRDAAERMLQNKISSLPVVDPQDKLVGILTHADFFLQPVHYPGAEGHLFEVLGQHVGLEDLEDEMAVLGRRPVHEFMSQPVTTITEDMSVNDIAKLMLHERRNRLPVVQDGKVIGIVCRHDFLNLLLKAKT